MATSTAPLFSFSVADCLRSADDKQLRIVAGGVPVIDLIGCTIEDLITHKEDLSDYIVEEVHKQGIRISRGKHAVSGPLNTFEGTTNGRHTAAYLEMQAAIAELPTN